MKLGILGIVEYKSDAKFIKLKLEKCVFQMINPCLNK